MERGYSLLEMLVVLAILGLIAVLAVPPISASIDHMRLADDTRILAAALREAREQALNEQSEVALTVVSHAIEGAGQRWSLSDSATLTYAAAEGGPKTFAFHADGTANGGTFRIARGKAKAYVRIDDITGAVEIAK
jgi:prepilin-type N-terminal cleavage/methylation domain-containing protein